MCDFTPHSATHVENTYTQSSADGWNIVHCFSLKGPHTLRNWSAITPAFPQIRLDSKLRSNKVDDGCCILWGVLFYREETLFNMVPRSR